MKKNIFIKSTCFFLLLLVLTLTAPLTAKSDDQGVEKGYITVTDCAGRKVRVPEKIDRIACMYLFTGHVV
ncbi:MAG: hypothetical protein P8Y00_11300, partial [Deltaproteobacteria bacterium]